MNNVKYNDSTKFISINYFDTCQLDGKSKKEIINLFPKRQDGAYYLNKFINYIEKYYKISIQEYVFKYLNIKWPVCPVSKEKVGFRVNGKGIFFSKFKKGKVCKKYSTAFQKACEKFSQNRKGKNNPMFGKKSWNSGLSKDSDARIKKISDERKGIVFKQTHKNKLKEARANHPLKARHVTKHTDESKKKMREATINRWQKGDFNFKKTSIEKKVEQWLLDNKIDFQFQYNIDYFIADFACLNEKILIECQGDFFHCNPHFEKYKNPKYEVQKRNIFRDKIKKEKYKQLGWKLIELWESDINSGEFKNILKCELKK